MRLPASDTCAQKGHPAQLPAKRTAFTAHRWKRLGPGGPCASSHEWRSGLFFVGCKRRPLQHSRAVAQPQLYGHRLCPQAEGRGLGHVSFFSPVVSLVLAEVAGFAAPAKQNPFNHSPGKASPAATPRCHARSTVSVPAQPLWGLSTRGPQ